MLKGTFIYLLPPLIGEPFKARVQNSVNLYPSIAPTQYLTQKRLLVIDVCMNQCEEYHILPLAQKYSLQHPTVTATIYVDKHWTSNQKTSEMPALLLKGNLCLAVF